MNGNGSGIPARDDPSFWRYYLTHSPNVTKIFMEAVNENPEYQEMGVRVHESEEAIDFSEPFGAILRHQRIRTGYPPCIAAELVELRLEDLIRLEMGWMLPSPEKLEQVLAAMCVFYGIDPLSFFRLLRIGEEYRQQEPMDLSELLGLEINESTLQLIPPDMLMRRKAHDFTRTRIQVKVQANRDGIEYPGSVIWKDGREFEIQKIDSAQKRAPFATGGIGTRFSCWLMGRIRIIGYEKPGDWFVETPCCAS